MNGVIGGDGNKDVQLFSFLNGIVEDIFDVQLFLGFLLVQ